MRPITQWKNRRHRQNKIRRAIHQPETQAQPVIQPLPQRQPQIAGVVFVMHLHLFMHRQRDHFENGQNNHKHDQRRQQPQQHRAFHTGGGQQRLDRARQRRCQQRAEQNADERERHANRALPPAQSRQRRQQQKS